jgi:hypothetical protein
MGSSDVFGLRLLQRWQRPVLGVCVCTATVAARPPSQHTRSSTASSRRAMMRRSWSSCNQALAPIPTQHKACARTSSLATRWRLSRSKARRKKGRIRREGSSGKTTLNARRHARRCLPCSAWQRKRWMLGWRDEQHYHRESWARATRRGRPGRK